MKKAICLISFAFWLVMLTACHTDNIAEITDTQPTQIIQEWAPGVIGLQEETDISTFENAMALWDTYADQAQLQSDGSFVLEFGFPSQNRASMWRLDADNRFNVQLYELSGDFWSVDYWLDGTTMGRISKETNPDGTYVELDEMLNNPEGNYMIQKTCAADGTILNKVEMWNNSWSVNYYNQTPENLTTEEQVKEILKAAYSEVDISQQEYYTLSYDTGTEEDLSKPYSYACRTEEGIQIRNVADPDNYYYSDWVDGEEIKREEQSTTDGYYYYCWDKESECTIKAREGIVKYSSGKQITFKVLPDETHGAKAYPLTENRDGIDITYHYGSFDSTYCYQATVTDHNTGDYLVFQLDSVRDPGYLDYFISVDWTHNGVTTHYDEDKNPLGILVYKIPWFPSDEIGVPWVSPPLRAVS